MTLKRKFGPKPLKIKVTEDEVIIRFDAQNWSGVYTELLKTIDIAARNRGFFVADRIGRALKLELRDSASSQESYDRLIRLCENLAAPEGKTQKPSDDVDPNTVDPK